MAKAHSKVRKVKKAKVVVAPLRWHFPSTDHGENQGFADSLLEYFQGDHEKYIAREAIQNAVDQRLDPDVPVSVVFEKYTIKATDFPGHAEFIDKLERCLVFVKKQPKAEEFFKSAIAQLKGKYLPVLKISDYNTKGLTGGDDEVDGNWYRLVRAAGTSNFKGVGGGSFGIGKGAPIAASGLRTVFYSSINDRGELVCQGKARLVSHHDEKLDVRQGVGFYGVDGYRAIRDESLVPNIFKRAERGTDVFIMDYKSGPDWQHKLVRSVLQNFWLSILNGGLEVTIRGGSELVITKENLEECLEKYDAREARQYFEAVTKRDTRLFEQDLKHLGPVSFFVRKDDSYPGNVMMARKPRMFVREKSYRVLREPHAGVFICENDKGNNLLRDLEPPAHDKWDPARADNGMVLLRELDTFIKQSLKTMSESITSEPEDIPGLSNYLPDSDDRDYLPSSSGDALEETGTSSDEESGREVGADKSSDDAEIETILRKSVVSNKQQGAVKLVPPQGPGKGSRGRATGSDSGNSEGVRINTSAISFRSFVQQDKKGLEYHFAITGREDCEGAIRIVAVGDDGTYPVDIASVVESKTRKSYETGESMIKGLKVEEGKTIRLSVRLESGRKYALGIETYEG